MAQAVRAYVTTLEILKDGNERYRDSLTSVTEKQIALEGAFNRLNNLPVGENNTKAVNELEQAYKKYTSAIELAEVRYVI